MKKLLKALIAIEFFLILIIVVLSVIENRDELPTAFVARNPSTENTSFRMLTKAVCEEKAEHTICHDKLFIKCNDKEYIINDDLNKVVECNNIRLNLSGVAVNGTILFENWTDLRNSQS